MRNDLPLLRRSSRKKEVVLLQQLLKDKGFFPYNTVQSFGPKTEAAVKKFQASVGLTADGIVGNMTWSALHGEKLDFNIIKPSISSLPFVDYFLKDDEYIKEILKKTQIYLHHTASGHNPFRVIDVWEKDKFDSKGKRKLNRISTAFVVGGQSTRDLNDDEFDGVIARCFDEKYWGYHTGWLGRTSDGPSIGIEICNYGYLTKNRKGEFINYVGGIVPEEQVCDLGKEFRGHRYYHKYTDKQLESVKKLILDLSDRFDIPIENINYDWDWFDYNPKKWKNGKGLRNHTQVRKDKTDLSPQPNLLKMLNSIHS
jgi:hypothetical protein